MPYAEPTSPIPSPTKEVPKLPRRHSHSHSHDFRSTSTPLPNIPRRSRASASSTPRKGTFNNAPRHASASFAASTLEAMRSIQSLGHKSPSGLPPARPQPSPQQSPAQEPQRASSGGLGLRLGGPSPHLARDSQSSDSSIDPATPEDNSVPLPAPARPSLLQRQRASRSGSYSSLPSPTESIGSHHHHPIRKKSGEVVKPSLKSRSMSTPDLGRKDQGNAKFNKAKSTRDLSEHTKSVRFDDLGLESVVLFLRGQKPTAVSKAAGSNEIQSETEEDNDTDLSDFVHFRTRRNGRAAEEQTEIQLDSCSAVPRVRTDFGPGTQGLLKDEHVILERVEMTTGSPLSLKGTVLVRNVSFQKWVAVRFTLDQWQTVSEVSGLHVSHIPSGTTSDEGWDRFSFTIKLDDYRRKLEERSMLLCVRFSVDGHEWWDSNNGSNYRFGFKAITTRKPRATASPFYSSSQPSTISTLRHSRAPEAPKNPRAWVFPRPPAEAAEPRPASPMLSPPPASAFSPPSAPDVHSHLQLKKWCAPSPPQSPPKILPPAAWLEPLVLQLAPERVRARPPPMTLVHGRPATEWPPVKEKKDVFEDGETAPSVDGDNICSSPQAATPNESSEDEKSPMPLRRTSSGADLNLLGTAGLMTPPSSNLSSPPTPTAMLLDSPSANMSTGDSSPANTLTSESPMEGNDDTSGRTLNAASYQEFLDKFCFFKSPPSVNAQLEDFGHYRAPGFSSPSYFNYGMAVGSATPPGCMTPTYDPYAPRGTTPTPTNISTASAAGSTPRASPSRSPVSGVIPDPAPGVAAA